MPFTRPTVVKSHASCRLDRSRPTPVVCPKISSNTFRRALTSLTHIIHIGGYPLLPKLPKSPTPGPARVVP